MKNAVILMLTALLFVSCKKTFMALNGIRKPKYETVESVSRKITAYDPEYLTINAIPRDSVSFWKILAILKDLPSDLIFNKTGALVDQNDTGYCAGRAMKFALGLGSSGSLTLDTTLTLSDLTTLLNYERSGTETDPSDFTMVIFWANFLGKTNKDVFRIMEHLKQTRALRINYLLVNMDVQKSWGIKIPYRF